MASQSGGSKSSGKHSDANRWFVFTIVCLITMLDFGIIFAFGAMFVDIMETFESDRSSTATVQSLLVGISLSFSVVSGVLISRFGLLMATCVSSFLVPFGFLISYFVTEIQHLYITISVISGIGISTIHVISIVVIQHMFPPSLQPMCFAIHGATVNIAGILYPLFIEWLLDTYDVHGTFLILGGMFINSVAAPMLLFNNTKFRRAKSKQDERNKGSEDIPDGGNSEDESRSAHSAELSYRSKDHLSFPRDKACGDDNNLCDKRDAVKQEDDVPDLEINAKFSFSTLLTKQYIFLLVASALCIPALNTFLALTVDIFVWKGFSVHQGLFSFVPFNVFSLLSKFVPVLAKKCTTRLSCFALPICFCITGLLSQLVVYVSANYALMLIGTSLVGLSLGGVFPAMLIAGAKIVSERDWPIASGLLMTVIGVFSSVLGPGFGSIRDRTGTYTTAIITIGILQAAGAVLYMLALFSRKNQLIRDRTPENVPEEMSRLKET